MLAIIALLIGAITLAMGVGAWEIGAKGYWLWLCVSVLSFIVFAMQIAS